MDAMENGRIGFYWHLQLNPPCLQVYTGAVMCPFCFSRNVKIEEVLLRSSPLLVPMGNWSSLSDSPRFLAHVGGAWEATLRPAEGGAIELSAFWDGLFSSTFSTSSLLFNAFTIPDPILPLPWWITKNRSAQDQQIEEERYYQAELDLPPILRGFSRGLYHPSDAGHA